MTNSNLNQLIELYTPYGVHVGTLPTACGLKREPIRADFDYTCECGYYVCSECGYPAYPIEVDEDGGVCPECGEGEMHKHTA